MLTFLRSNRARVGRFVRRMQDLHEKTGSLPQTLTYLVRFTGQKVPMLARHAGETLRRGAVVRDLAALRRERGDDAVLVCIKATGGLGDFIVIARFFRDLFAACEPVVFDVCASVPGQAEWIFSGVPGFRSVLSDSLFDAVRPSYDVAFSVTQSILVHGDGAATPALRKAPRLAAICRSISRYGARIEPFITHQPTLDNGLARRAVFAGASRRDFLHAIAKVSYGGDGLPVATSTAVQGTLAGRDRPVLTVHNGFDSGFIISGRRATKCYPHFDRVVELVKAHHPDLLVVQLGTDTSTPIPAADINLIGRTNLKEAAGVIAGAVLHLDNEGGLVHLAACYGVPSCVLFGPTPSDYFGYPGNINIDPPVCGNCWWIESTWMDRCPRGFDRPICLDRQDPADVAARISSRLDERPARRAAG